HATPPVPAGHVPFLAPAAVRLPLLRLGPPRPGRATDAVPVAASLAATGRPGRPRLPYHRGRAAVGRPVPPLDPPAVPVLVRLRAARRGGRSPPDRLTPLAQFDAPLPAQQRVGRRWRASSG